MTLRGYFKDLKKSIGTKKVKVRIEKEEIFSPQTRSAYFSTIFSHFPRTCLLFIDPDTGIKDQNYNEKHLSFDELNIFRDQLDTESVLMIGQHFQKNRLFGRSDPESKAADVIRLTSSSPFIIADNTVMFIFLTKNSQLRSVLSEILKNYKIKIQSLVKDPKKKSSYYSHRIGSDKNL